MTNNQLKKAFNYCFLLKNKVIMDEINNIIAGYKVDSVEFKDEHYIIKFLDKNKNSINMIIDGDCIHISRTENNVFSNIAIYDSQIMRQTDIEKRSKGVIYTETAKKFTFSKRFNGESVLVDLEEESYAFGEEIINTILNNQDFRNVDLPQIFTRLKSLGMKMNLEDTADLFTTFSTHMNYYYNWDGGRQIKDNIYPTKTLVNGENLSMLFDVNDGPDKLYRVHDLYKGIIYPRTECDIISINSGFIPSDAFSYKRFCGISDTEDSIVGEAKKNLSTKYVDYLEGFFKDAFGYTGEIDLDRASLLSIINNPLPLPDAIDAKFETLEINEESKKISDRQKSFIKRFFNIK